MKDCQPFFAFNKGRNRIHNNPWEPKILARTDFIFSES